MIKTTYSGTAVYLLPYLPDFGSRISARFKVLSGSVDASLTNKEERETMSTPRVGSFKFSTVLDNAESTPLKAELDAIDNRPVLVPFWPAVKLHSDATTTPSITSRTKLWIEMNDLSKWELGTGSAPSGFTPSASCFVVPVMWSKFDKLPLIKPVNALGEVVVSFELFENGAIADGLKPATITLGTQTVAGQVVPVLTVPCAWGENTAQHEVRVERQQIGWGRHVSETYFPNIPRQRWNLNFEAMTGAEANYLLALFWDRRGQAGPWMVPSVHDTYSKSIGRFACDTIDLTWEKPALGNAELVSCKLEAITLPTEAVVQAGEALGLTLGGKPSRWFGYVVTDGTNTWRYTPNESASAGPGGTYEPRPIMHGRIRKEINLAIDDADVTFESWVGCPFVKLLTQENTVPLKMTIYQGVLSDPAGAVAIYTGTVQTPSSDNNRIWKMKLRGPGALGSVKGPMQTMAPECSARLGDARCGIDVDALASTQTLTSWNGDTVVCTTGSASTYADDYFGTLERTVDGVKQRYLVLNSVKNAGGDQQLTLECALSPTPTASETVKLYPGCNGTPARCKALGNWLRFRGRPFVPNANPSVVPISSTTGGKK